MSVPEVARATVPPKVTSTDRKRALAARAAYAIWKRDQKENGLEPTPQEQGERLELFIAEQIAQERQDALTVIAGIIRFLEKYFDLAPGTLQNAVREWFKRTNT